MPAVKVLGSQAMINEVLGVQLMDLHTNKAYKPFTIGWSKEDPRQAVGKTWVPAQRFKPDPEQWCQPSSGCTPSDVNSKCEACWLFMKWGYSCIYDIFNLRPRRAMERTVLAFLGKACSRLFFFPPLNDCSHMCWQLTRSGDEEWGILQKGSEKSYFLIPDYKWLLNWEKL